VTAPALDTSDPRADELRREVLDALEAVRDPELDEPITVLGFVAACTVSREAVGPVVSIRLRLPTYFCAPNFAFLMVADAYEAASAVPGIGRAEVALEDHFASDAINAGVAARAGFASSFAGFAEGELDQLRVDFVRKAVLAGTERVSRPLLTSGRRPEELAELTLGELPPSADLDRLRARRTELGLPAGPDAPLLIDPITGDRVDLEAVPLHLRKARLTAVNQEANSGVCRGMLRARYPGSTGT